MAESLTLVPWLGLGIASVMARKGVDAAAIGAVVGGDMPDGPRVVFAGQRFVVGTGPGTWLVIEDSTASDFAEDLQASLVGLASVSDQSSGYCVQRLSGPSARTLLQRGAAVDFHSASFGVGSAATTVIAHIGVILWQIDDRPSYGVATFRSYAGSFRHWFDRTAASL